MNRPDEFISDDHRAELEDRAAELVERDWLLSQERDDNADARAAHQLELDRATLTAHANRWEAIKARTDHPSDYGWRDFSWWTDVG